jgi:phage gpG-like protein
MASMDFDSGSIKKRLQALLDAKATALNMAGASLLADVQQSFVQSGPGWQARKPPTGTWKLLWKSGTLFRSMTMAVGEVDSSVSVGTNVSYAIFLNEGTRKMVARPFLFLDDTRIQDATDAFHNVLQSVVNS